MIFDLVQDFADVLEAMPREHPRRRILMLLDEAIRRDVHFIVRHPTTLFQCLWNSCWWYGNPEAERHYEPSPDDTTKDRVVGLTTLVEIWRERKEAQTPGFHWLRSLRPPGTALGTALLAVLRGHEGAVTDVLFSRDGSHIITGGSDGIVRVWDAASGAELWNCYAGTGDFGLGGVALSPDGLSVSVGCDEGRVTEWDARTGEFRDEFRTPTGYAMCVAYSPDSCSIACGDIDGVVRVWDIAGRHLVTNFKHQRTVTGLAYSPDGRLLVTGCQDGAVRVWDVPYPAPPRVLGEGLGKVFAVAFSPDGRRALGAAARDVDVWDVHDGQLLFSLQGHRGAVRAVAYSADGARIVTGSEDRTVRLWDARDGSWLGYDVAQEGEVTAVAFSPDGRWLAAGGDDMVVRVWDATASMTPRRLQGHADAGRPVVYSPDGALVATGAWDAIVCVWGAATGELLLRLRGHEGIVNDVSFSPDGRLLASASADHTVRVWDPQTGTQRHCLRGHRDSVSVARFSGDGSRLLSWGSDHVVREWDVGSGTCLRADEAQRQFEYDTPPRSCTWDAGACGDHEVPTETAVAEVPRGMAACPGVPAVAWFPAPLFWNELHPFGHGCVGFWGPVTYFLALEGNAAFDPRAVVPHNPHNPSRCSL